MFRTFKKKTLLTAATALILAATTATPASAWDAWGSWNDAWDVDENKVTSHALVEQKPYADYADDLPLDAKYELRNYIQYQFTREPCPNFLPVPQGFDRVGCELVPERRQKVAMVRTDAGEDVRFTDVINDYELHFEFDSAKIEDDAADKIDQAAREISKYNPSQVTLKGFTDTSGPSDYNRKLSRERAQSVADALEKHGIKSYILDKKAYGENNLAVNTNDGVRLRENRRVVIQFRE